MTKRKRGNGEGTVYKRKDGRYEAAKYLAHSDGSRKKISAYGKTAQEARASLAIKVERCDRGLPTTDSSMTVSAWIATWETTALAASSRKPQTRYTYHSVAKSHIIPNLGTLRLRELRARHIEAMLVKMEQDGMSGSSRRMALQVLRAALRTAVRDGLIASDPSAVVSRPRQTPKSETKSYTPDDTRVIFDAVKKERLSALVTVVGYTGIRIGEALALRWSDVDLETSHLTVSGTLTRHGHKTLTRTEPKSARSRRTLPLPPAAKAALVEHRRKQAAERLLAGESWRDVDAVFATDIGGWIEPRTASRWFNGIVTKAKVGGSWHSFRHGTATHMLMSGVPMASVSAVLGHADIRTTVGIYGHVGTDHLAAAMQTMTEGLG